ncbi:MAG: tRNA-dependent cyclodipeptide synthase [Patescibacteria group bacterium]
MSVTIKEYLNVTPEEIEAKEHNIYIGISLGNKFFSPEHIKEYLLWALKYTKDDVLVLIADRIHAINYQVFNNYKEARAISRALRIGKDKHDEIEKVIEEFPESQRKRMHIIGWEEVVNTSAYSNNIAIIKEQFASNTDFHDAIFTMIDDSLGQRARDLSNEKKELLSNYILEEFPILLCGIDFGGKEYTLFPYPGIGYMDKVMDNIIQHKEFPDLFDKVTFLKKEVAKVEMYCDE